MLRVVTAEVAEAVAQLMGDSHTAVERDAASKV